MVWALLIFTLALIPQYMPRCLIAAVVQTCSQKIQTANPGDIIVLTNQPGW